MTSASSLAQVVAALERRYPPSTAEEWDAVGLVCGDPAAPVRQKTGGSFIFQLFTNPI